MKPSHFTIKQFNAKFPTDDACLDHMFMEQYGNLSACPKCGVISPRYYRVKRRKCYECRDCGHQLHPLANTIFHKSSTSLRDWFHVIYIFSVSKNGVSAKEVQRQLGVTYKCAWRLAHQVRLLMERHPGKLSGIVEADETYVGGKHKNAEGFSKKTPVLGLAERNGFAKAVVSRTASTITARNFIEANVSLSAVIHTDESLIYRHVSRMRTHEAINHAKGEYGRGNVTTNTIEGFWSQLKRSLDGTHHAVSPKYLQRYVNERVFHYNHRPQPVFPALLGAAVQRVR